MPSVDGCTGTLGDVKLSKAIPENIMTHVKTGGSEDFPEVGLARGIIDKNRVESVYQDNERVIITMQSGDQFSVGGSVSDYEHLFWDR